MTTLSTVPKRLYLKASAITRDIVEGVLPHDYPEVVKGYLCLSGAMCNCYQVKVHLRERGWHTTWWKPNEIRKIEDY